MNFKLMTSISLRFNTVITVLLLMLTTLPFSALHAEESEEAEMEQEPAVTLYIEMGSPFITHVGEPQNKLKYLKANVTLRASSETVQSAVQAHMPRLRHELVMLFGEQKDLDVLSSSQGQEALREEARTRINTVLKQQQVEEEVADVLFTTFVVQR